MGSNLAY